MAFSLKRRKSRAAAFAPVIRITMEGNVGMVDTGEIMSLLHEAVKEKYDELREEELERMATRGTYVF